MTVASLSLFRFAGLRDRLWAFGQMAWARRPLAADPEILFFKLLGTGSREGFHPYPNFAVVAILAEWPSLECGRRGVEKSDVFRRYRARAEENWTAFLGPARTRGQWDGAVRFAAPPGAGVANDRPVAVLTRATIRPTRVFAFWRQVPDIARTTPHQDGLYFKVGLGEVPWFHQVTFTVWRDRAALDAFTFSGYHGAAIARANEGGWFKESMFARFDLLHAEGVWQGMPDVGAEVHAGACHDAQAAADAVMAGRR